jgi:hypothetical protein
LAVAAADGIILDVDVLGSSNINVLSLAARVPGRIAFAIHHLVTCAAGSSSNFWRLLIGMWSVWHM